MAYLIIWEFPNYPATETGAEKTSHPQFSVIVGPFKTTRGANFLRNNPTVSLSLTVTEIENAATY